MDDPGLPEHPAPAKEPRFLRFPLALLALYPDDRRQTLETILAVAAMRVGNAKRAALSPADALGLAVSLNRAGYERFQPTHPWELAVFIGCAVLGFHNHPPAHLVRRCEIAADFLEGQDASSGENTVTLRPDFFLAALTTAHGASTRHSLSFREFQVLCALLSKIGKSKLAKCGWEEIQARAAGWCGKRIMHAATEQEWARRRPLLLGREKIRRTLDRLESDRFMARVVVGNHESWYSFSCGHDRGKLLQWIREKKTRRADALRALREQDRLFSAEMAGL